MTETRRKHMRNMRSERDESLTCGVNVPFGWVINGCVDSSLATSCQEFEPNSWTAWANMRRSTLFRLDASSSGVDVARRVRTPEAMVCWWVNSKHAGLRRVHVVDSDKDEENKRVS